MSKRKARKAQPSKQIESVKHTGGPVHVGDKVLRRPKSFSNHVEADTGTIMRGIVVYIHSKGRFHVVAFGEAPYVIRESFMGVMA